MTVSAQYIALGYFYQDRLCRVSAGHVCNVAAFVCSWAVVKLQCPWILVIAAVLARLNDLIQINQVTLVLCQFYAVHTAPSCLVASNLLALVS
jgi:hypothetical protein